MSLMLISMKMMRYEKKFYLDYTTDPDSYVVGIEYINRHAFIALRSLCVFSVLIEFNVFRGVTTPNC